MMVRYRKITKANNVHPDKNIHTPMKSHLRYPKHGKHHLIREADVDQVICSR